MKRLIRIKIRNHWYDVEVDNSTSPPGVWVNGEPIDVEIEVSSAPIGMPTTVARRVGPKPPPHTGQSLGLQGITPSSAQSSVLAPMAGRLVSISVKVGDSVSAGDEVAIMETMKMEQSICTSRDGVVKNIPVSPVQIVAAGQELVEFE
jgi:biotin carboxyl carrier protein